MDWFAQVTPEPPGYRRSQSVPKERGCKWSRESWRLKCQDHAWNLLNWYERKRNRTTPIWRYWLIQILKLWSKKTLFDQIPNNWKTKAWDWKVKILRESTNENFAVNPQFLGEFHGILANLSASDLEFSHNGTGEARTSLKDWLVKMSHESSVIRRSKFDHPKNWNRLRFLYSLPVLPFGHINTVMVRQASPLVLGQSAFGRSTILPASIHCFLRSKVVMSSQMFKRLRGEFLFLSRISDSWNMIILQYLVCSQWPIYFATTEILKGFQISRSHFPKKHQSIPKLHKWLPKRTLALDIESCTAMSDVFNRRWAMLPRSDRLIGELENKSGTKKGKCRRSS